MLAKVTRDRIMIAMHERFPGYGFAAHKGYITAEHAAALAATARARSTAAATSTCVVRCRDRGLGDDVLVIDEDADRGGGGGVSAEDLEKYETEMELQLYREYRDVVGQFDYVVETERRFYLANEVEVEARNGDGEIYFEMTHDDAWVWDMYRPRPFVKNVRVLTFRDVNVEELASPRSSPPRPEAAAGSSHSAAPWRGPLPSSPPGAVPSFHRSPYEAGVPTVAHPLSPPSRLFYSLPSLPLPSPPPPPPGCSGPGQQRLVALGPRSDDDVEPGLEGAGALGEREVSVDPGLPVAVAEHGSVLAVSPVVDGGRSALVAHGSVKGGDHDGCGGEGAARTGAARDRSCRPWRTWWPAVPGSRCR